VSPQAAPVADPSELAVSLVRDDLLFRAERAIGLIPATGSGIGRRALLFAGVTWFPIAVWAAFAHRVLPGTVDEPLLEHFGVHVRCLVAIPLLVLAEAMAQAETLRIVPYFVRSGLVTEADRPRLREVVRSVVRLRNATLPWVVMAGALIAWLAVAPTAGNEHELLWAAEGEAGTPRFGFGGWWLVFVARPVFIALLLAWLWRLALVCLLLGRIARLDLAIVQTHPDRAGGLGFLEGFPTAFSLVVLAVSAVVASHWAHQVVYHGVAVQSLFPSMAALVAIALVLFLAPLVLFAARFGPAKRRALLDYGALVGEHGRRVRRRWILGEKVADDGRLDAPELGPVADTLTLYEAVQKMRPIPIGRRAVVAIALPAVIPILVVLALQIPLKSLVLGLLKAIA
jgi:hypothetical protein